MPYSSSTACTSWYRAATDQWRRFLKEGFGQKFRGSAAVDHGRIIADDTPERLKAIHVGDKIILGFDHETEAASAASRIPHLHLAGTLVGVVILSAFCLGLGALSYTLALASKNQEWLFWTVQQTLLFPPLLLAGMLLPIDGGPGWLRTLSKFNPLSYVVDAERTLFNGDIWNSTTLTGAIAAVSVGALGLVVGVRAMRRSD